MTVNGNSKQFLFYRSGVLDSKDCDAKLTHAVIGVGYGKDEKTGKDYILIKNSWGRHWGDKGYAKISPSTEHHNKGVCGILGDNHIAFVKLEDAREVVNEFRKSIEPKN
jgi:hypothetical protein